MKKILKKVIAYLLVAIMVSASFSGFAPAMETEAAAASRTWYVLTAGSNNTNGHNYGNASAAGPLFYTDSDKVMEKGGTISMALKPSNNWGVFYSYIDDSNWLYVGHDDHSGWYFQYRLNGSEQYPQISGLPEYTAGEEISLSISLSNETLGVTVNGTTVHTTNQKLIDLADEFTSENGNMGKFGVMTKGQTSISFADFKYNNVDCMEDNWVFNAERAGQVMTEEVTAMSPVTGTVKNAEGEPVEGATVRVGFHSATTDANGAYAFEGIQVGTYAFAVTKAGYQPYEGSVTIVADQTCVADATLSPKAALDLTAYDSIESDLMKVYIGKDFPVVARYEMKDQEGKFFRGNETDLNTVVINGATITPEVKVAADEDDYRDYELKIVNEANSIDLTMVVRIEVYGRNLNWSVVSIDKEEGCARIATIDIPHLNLLSVDASEEGASFAGAQVSTDTTNKADTHITFEDGFVPSEEDGYVYAFLSNGTFSAGLHSNSEMEGDYRVERINGADNMSLTSAVWYYESGDRTGQASAAHYEYQLSELPEARVAISKGDENGDGDIDWNDGAIAFRDVMHTAYGTEAIKDIVNYRIVMNFESAASNPFLATADNVKKVYLATDGLPQALLLKGYGNEGHDSANSEYADIAEREGGVEDFQKLIEIAHDYNTEVGIHVNAQEAYPESKSFNVAMLSNANGVLNGNGWGWLDQSVVINKLWDLSSDARLKRFVQLYDRINETSFYSGDWEEGEYVKDSQGYFTDNNGNEVSREEVLALISEHAETQPDNMDFIYLDVWYQDAWETRRIAEEINSLGWRFSTEFSDEGEYDSTWQHWSTDTTYGGKGMKGYNSDIIRFLKNDLRDSQVLNWPAFGGTADNPLLGAFRLYGFEGWGGQQNFETYIEGTFNENLPTKFLQQYQIVDWEDYPEGESPVGNTEKEITLSNGEDVVVVTRNEEQRSDIEIERTIKLNDKVVLNTDVEESTYLLPWMDNQNGEEKLYHWNLDGGTTTWNLQEDWAALENVLVYELSDQGRGEELSVAVEDGKITLTAKASTAYVVVKGNASEEVKVKELKADFGEGENVVDPGFNGYADGEKLAAPWTGDIDAEGVAIKRTSLGDQKLEMSNATKDTAVSIELTDLVAGDHYVAEAYVENLSDGLAMIEVDAGTKVVSNYTERSIVTNTVSSDSEHGTKMQRMLVSFVAEGPTAQLTLSKTAGAGYVHWDDIRIVEQELNNFREDGSFVQDFESVVQGLYPFVLKYNAGGDSRTHLSQLNAPYTQAGWNGKSVDDVLGGEWSLKHHTNINGVVYQTIPQNFRFEPGKVYNVEFDYQTVSRGYQMISGDGETYSAPTTYLAPTAGTAHASMQVVGSGSGRSWIGLYMNGSLCESNTAIGNVDFILDNLVITEDKEAVAVTINKTDLYLGESAEIFGAGLDKVTWTVSEDGIVEVDKENNKINAVGTGSVTLTAAYGEGETETFEMTVVDTLAQELPAEAYENLSATANTEELTGEGAGNGIIGAAVDGDSNTFWHTAWSSSSFKVSASNPAVLTFDLGETLEIGGFMIQNRSGRSDRGILTYNYQVLDADGKEVAAGTNMEVPSVSQQGGAWFTQLLDENVEAKTVVVSVTSTTDAAGGTCAIAEFKPILVQKVATEATLADAEVETGKTVELEAVPVNGNMLKGLVWTSSNENVATVDANGVVTGVKAGTATITLSNGLGELATCTVTVVGGEAYEEVCEVFADVPHGAWYEGYVQYVYDNGLMAGSNGLFNPTKNVTRAQLVTTLHRLAGEPAVTDRKALTDFTDVVDGLYYTDAVCWAYNIGVGTGNDGKFNPTGNLTRQQMAAFLYRFADVMGYDTTQTGDYSDMLNADQVSAYAEEAVSWAVGAGLISGSEVTNADGSVSYDLKPRGNTTRAQLAAILQRFCEGN